MAPRPLTTPRKEPRQERARATVDAILGATARVLVKEGYDRASTNRIAARGRSQRRLALPVLPEQGGARRGAHREALDATCSATSRSALPVIRPNAPLRDMVRDVVHAMVEAHRVDPKLHRVLMEQVPRVGALKRLTEIDDRALAPHSRLPRDAPRRDSPEEPEARRVPALEPRRGRDPRRRPVAPGVPRRSRGSSTRRPR